MMIAFLSPRPTFLAGYSGVPLQYKRFRLPKGTITKKYEK